MNVLVSLYRGYGLGDAVQMTAVLQHVVKHRPGWSVDFLSEYPNVGRGIARRTLSYGEESDRRYDAEVQLLLYDTCPGWIDRPNTRAAVCLHDKFGLPWDPSCGRYRVDVSEESLLAARTLLPGINYVAIHYQGDSAQAAKDLTHEQASALCAAVERLGCTPLALDWRRKSQLPCRRLTAPVEWGRDAEMVCAVLRCCKAFVGIDSGPGKCASATDTPSLIVWTGHNPAQYHDPAPNTVHMVPANTSLYPWFEANYSVRRYKNDPVPATVRWLKEVL